MVASRSIPILLVFLALGCGSGTRGKTQPEVSDRALRSEVTKASFDGPADAVDRDFADFEPDAPVVRDDAKIVYTATLSLVVDDFAFFADALRTATRAADGYVTGSSQSVTSGRTPSGQWTLRVPAGSYGGLLASLGGLGVVESQSENAQDVTEKYIDLSARKTNLERLEARITELLEVRNGKLEEVLDVERELARVRTNVERIAGQLRYLENRVAWSTITVNAREERDYEPPKAPPFGREIELAWEDALEDLVKSGEGFVLFVVRYGIAVVLWGGLLSGSFWLVLRRLQGRRREVDSVSSAND